MAQYNIWTECFLGMSHCGSVTADGSGMVDLTDKEVEKLVEMIRQCDSDDLEVLNLKDTCPEIYEKLEQAHRDAAYQAEYMHWLREGYDGGYYGYDQEELMSYCEEECGFSFDEDPDDFTDEDGEFDEEAYEESKYEAFVEWLDDYIYSLDDEEFVDFLVNHMNAEVDMSSWSEDYTVSLPPAIIEMAAEAEEK